MRCIQPETNITKQRAQRRQHRLHVSRVDAKAVTRGEQARAIDVRTDVRRIRAQPAGQARILLAAVDHAGQCRVRPTIRQQAEVPRELRVLACLMHRAIGTPERSRERLRQGHAGEARGRRQQQGQPRHALSPGT